MSTAEKTKVPFVSSSDRADKSNHKSDTIQELQNDLDRRLELLSLPIERLSPSSKSAPQTADAPLNIESGGESTFNKLTPRPVIVTNKNILLVGFCTAQLCMTSNLS